MANGLTDAEVEEFLLALDAWCDGEHVDPDRGELTLLAAVEMAEFVAARGSGGLTEWSSGDIVEYLLGYVPRAVHIEPDDLERFPSAVAAVFRFLGETGRIDADVATGSANAVTSLTDVFVLEAGNPANFGPSKALFMAMAGDGVDTSDQAAVNAWLERWNSLTIEERRRLPMAFPGESPNPSARPPAVRRTAKARKAQRQARRRNRRR